MPDSRLECPICERLTPVIWLGGTLVYRPHNDPATGRRCRGSRGKVKQ